MSGQAKQVKFEFGSNSEVKSLSQDSSSAPSTEEDQVRSKDQGSDDDQEDDQTSMTIHKGADFRTVQLK